MIKEIIDALKKVILIEERVQSLSDKTLRLASEVQDIDKRLVALEAKFDLMIQIAGSRNGQTLVERKTIKS